MISYFSFCKHARVFARMALMGTALICTALLTLTHPAHSAGSGVYDFSLLYPEYSQAAAPPIVPSGVSSTSVSASTSVSSSGAEQVSATDGSYTGIADGYYVGSRLMLSVADLNGIELHNGRGYTFQENGEDFDVTMGTGFLVGYDWKSQGIPIRTELEYAYRFRHDSDTIEIGPTPALGNIGYKNNLSTHSLMLSGFYDFKISSKWEPYVGVGVGWARNHSEYTRAPNLNIADQTIETDVDNFAYSFQAGARYPFSSRWVGELGYRFIDFGEVESGAFSGGDSVTADHHFSHDIVLGISYMY